MEKNKKVKVNVKSRVSDNICDLSLSELNEVPAREISLHKRVTTLDLSSNRLMTLGKNFPMLVRLVKLDLSKNQIKYLPQDFGLLCNLKHLDLYDNKLEHLPLSFGNLNKLRYLDLKSNPLTPALAKIVGHCLTTKECQDAARNTVKFLARMQTEAEKTKLQLQLEAQSQINNLKTVPADNESLENQIPQKPNKKSKSKAKKSNTVSSITKIVTEKAKKSPLAQKPGKTKKNSNGAQKSTTRNVGSTAITSILTFFVLLLINIIVIYVVMFKNPELAEMLVEIIPHQYRDWILTKTEVFRLRVTEWITEFRTPPEDH